MGETLLKTHSYNTLQGLATGMADALAWLDAQAELAALAGGDDTTRPRSAALDTRGRAVVQRWCELLSPASSFRAWRDAAAHIKNSVRTVFPPVRHVAVIVFVVVVVCASL